MNQYSSGNKINISHEPSSFLEIMATSSTHTNQFNRPSQCVIVHNFYRWRTIIYHIFKNIFFFDFHSAVKSLNPRNQIFREFCFRHFDTTYRQAKTKRPTKIVEFRIWNSGLLLFFLFIRPYSRNYDRNNIQYLIASRMRRFCFLKGMKITMMFWRIVLTFL